MPICPFCYQAEDSTRSSSSSQFPCGSTIAESHCNACTNLADLDAKIADARQSLLDMQAHRLRLLSDVNRAHDSISRRFPVEIISNIFRQCLPDLDTLRQSKNGRLATVPLRLSQVCRHWRTICHSIPSMWNVMALYIKEPQEFSFQRISQVAREWMARSGDKLPLSVVLKVDPEADPGGRNCFSIFKAIADYGQRLDYLFIRASNTVLNCLHALDGNLSTLDVAYAWSDPSYAMDGLDIGFSSKRAPRPRNLNLNDVRWKDIAVSPINLTYLEVTDIWFPDITIFFACAPNLISFKFDRISIDPDSDENPMGDFPISPPMEHQCLETLHMESDVHDVPAGFFASFNLPSLQSLVLKDCEDSDWRAFFVAFANHVQRSGSQLQSLVIRSISFDTTVAGDFQWLTQALEMICSPMLNRVDLEAVNLEDDITLASAIATVLHRLPGLSSIRLYTCWQTLIHILRVVLVAGSETRIRNGLRLSITIWSRWDALLDDNTGNIHPDTLSYHNEACPPLEAKDIHEILGLLNHESIMVAIIQYPFQYSLDLEEAAIDITEKVVADLRHVLHQREADSST